MREITLPGVDDSDGTASRRREKGLECSDGLREKGLRDRKLRREEEIGESFERARRGGLKT